jgi:hypothetical protein
VTSILLETLITACNVAGSIYWLMVLPGMRVLTEKRENMSEELKEQIVMASHHN